MEKAILGKKIGMTQIFKETGEFVPVTVVEAGPCFVTYKKSLENDGYVALQYAYGDVKEQKVNKPMKGHFAKANVPLKKYLHEFILDNMDGLNVGDEIKADIFAEGDKIDVTGISKGKGFAGTIKRWNFHRGPMSHGAGPVHRHAGSMGANSDPSRIMKGKKLPGHMGNEQVTVQNLDVVKIILDKNLILIRGAIPGPKGGLIMIKNTVKE